MVQMGSGSVSFLHDPGWLLRSFPQCSATAEEATPGLGAFCVGWSRSNKMAAAEDSPSGREPAAVVAAYRRPASTVSFSSQRPRGKARQPRAARNKWLSLVTARTPSTICVPAKNPDSSGDQVPLADSGPVTSKKAIVFCCLPLSTALPWSSPRRPPSSP